MKQKYIATFSDLMRIALVNDDVGKAKAQELAEEAVDIITNAEDIAKSLKNETIAGVTKAIRQIDMKNEKDEIILKTFTGWNIDLNCWHVLLEFAFETYWENRTKPIGKG